VIVRRFIAPLTLSAMIALCAEASGQGTFPAPQPNQPSNSSPFPSPSSGSAAAQGGGSAEQQECMAKFAPLRQDAEKRAQAIKAASERKASPQESCGLIKSYVEAEATLVSFVTARQTACGIPANIPKQLEANQARTQQLMKAVCAAANDRSPGDRFRPPPGQLPDAAPSRNLGDDIFIPRLMERQGHGR
jgi:hypothetical protein